MNLGRNPASCVSSSLGGRGNITSGAKVLYGPNIAEKPDNEQIVRSGNRCGHRKNKLKVPLFLRKISKRNRHPHSIEEAIRILRQAVYWFRSSRKKRKVLLQELQPNLSLIRTFERIVYLFVQEEFRELFFHDGKATKSGKRKRRSEGVESTILFTLSTLFNYVDLQTLAIGIRHDSQNFTYANYAYLAQKAGCSETRIKRAMMLLQKIGLVSVKNINKTLDDGHIITIRTEIFLSEDAFTWLGLKEEFNKDRESAFKKYHKEQLHEKVKSFNDFKKSTKQIAKKELKQIRKIVNEIPGSERKRDKELFYSDYTGLASNRKEVISRNEPSQVAKTFLSIILSKLKPPS